MIIDTCVLCENIRFELGNKHSLMGVFDKTIRFSVSPDKVGSWPKGQQLALFIRAKGEEEDEIPDNSRIIVFAMQKSGKRELISFAFEPKRPKIRNYNLVINVGNFMFEGPGEVVFTLEIQSETEDQVISPLTLYTIEAKEIVTH